MARRPQIGNPRFRAGGRRRLTVETLEDRTTPTASLAIPAPLEGADLVPLASSASTTVVEWSAAVDFGASARDLQMVAQANGRLGAFLIEPNGTVSVRWQSSPGGSWSSAANFGSSMSSLSVAAAADGRLEVFAIGKDQALYQRSQLSPNGSWGNWVKVGGSFQSVAVALNAENRLEVFLLDTKGALQQRRQIDSSGRWGGTIRVGGSYQKIDVVRNLAGRLETFALAKDGKIFHRWQTSDAGAWSSWSRLDGELSDFNAVLNTKGTIEIFGLSLKNGSIQHRAKSTAEGSWTSWRSLGGNYSELLAVNDTASTRLFAVDSRGRLSTTTLSRDINGSLGTWESLGTAQGQLEAARNTDGRWELLATSTSNRTVLFSQKIVVLPPPTVPTPTPTPVPTPKPTVPTPKPTSIPQNDSPSSWHLTSLATPQAWNKGYSGQGVVVAVLDTGVDLDHDDLDDNIWRNLDEIAGNGVDDDGNGFIDDVLGWDFVEYDNDPNDTSGHGTHVAGIIAAESNGFGVTGIAPNAEIMPIRVLDSSGGSSYDVARGIIYAVNNGADIINISLGSSFNNPAVEDAIAYAHSKGVFIVAGSGNDGADQPSYPAIYSQSNSNVLSVGAHDTSLKQVTATNNVGSSKAVQVDAPGVNVYSTWINDTYRSMSGTSMAAPQVSGIAALVLSARPSLTPEQLRDIIIRSAIKRISNSDGLGGVYAAGAVDLALSSSVGLI